MSEVNKGYRNCSKGNAVNCSTAQNSVCHDIIDSLQAIKPHLQSEKRFPWCKLKYPCLINSNYQDPKLGRFYSDDLDYGSNARNFGFTSFHVIVIRWADGGK